MEPNDSKSAHLDRTINICKGFANTQVHKYIWSLTYLMREHFVFRIEMT